MACHQKGDKPFSEPMMAYFTDAYMRCLASMSKQENTWPSYIYNQYEPAEVLVTLAAKV